MVVIGKDIIVEFSHKHADARGNLAAWLAEVENSEWENPHQLKERYPRASILGNKRVVFDIRGNEYRLLATVSYKHGTVVVEKIGTYAEYDTWTL